MPIRWSAAELSHYLDSVEKLYGEASPHLSHARELVVEATAVRNLPGYMLQRLTRLRYEIERCLSLKQVIDKVREDIPQKDLAIQTERAKYGVQQKISL